MVKQRYQAVIGLEVHVQLNTKSKIFSSSSTAFGADPNTQIDPVCLGLPGVLPVLNKKVVEHAIRMGLATGCHIAERSIFARKHYFYPDLPKGYQISQFEEPLCENGHLDLQLEKQRPKRIRIVRIHLEEDAGKSVHQEEYVAKNETLIDLNRCGVPLIEIVTAPDMHTPEEAAAFVETIRQLVRYLDISDGNMEQGSLRCDANISVRPHGAKSLGVKTELKNMNTISGVAKALVYEIDRQIAVLQKGGRVVQQTLLWDAERNLATPMRTKEQSHDYRYMPDPDLVPLVVDAAWREKLQADLPELPWKRRNRLMRQYNLPQYDADLLCAERAMADYFESVATQVEDAKTASNWVMGNVMRVLKEQKIDITDFTIQPERLAALIGLLEEGDISGNSAKKVFDEMLGNPKTPAEIVAEKGLRQVSDEGELEKLIDEVLASHSDEVARYRAGEHKLMGFFVGQLMRATKGTANPAVLNKLLRKKLHNA